MLYEYVGMSTRQLIFVGCKILGMYLIISGIATLPLLIGFWQDYYRGPGGAMRDMQVSMFFRSMFGPAFTLLSGLVLFFGTDKMTRLIVTPGPRTQVPDSSANLSWGIALVASIYMLLLQLPSVLAACGIYVLKQLSGDGSTDEYSWQRMIINELPAKTFGCLVALLFAYVSLRAIYGSRPFKWWNGAEGAEND